MKLNKSRKRDFAEINAHISLINDEQQKTIDKM